MDTNLRSRLVSALVAIPLLILLVGWSDSWLFTGVFLILTVVALREYFVMALPGCVKEQILGMLFGVVLFFWLLSAEVATGEIPLGLVLVLLFSLYTFLGGRLEERLKRLAWTLLGALYLGYLLPHWVLLFHMPNGRGWVFFVLLVIMIGDTSAYFAGKCFGSKKLAPSLSPGKTVEGALGYIAGSVLAGWVGGKLLVAGLSGLEVVVLSGALSILGQMGDLFESWLKRAFAVKDTGAWLPGHGGLLDRLDSLIFPAVFTTTYLKVFHS